MKSKLSNKGYVIMKEEYSDKEVKKIKKDFLRKHKVNLITLSTFDKKSISKIKSKLIKYVS